MLRSVLIQLSMKKKKKKKNIYIYIYIYKEYKLYINFIYIIKFFYFQL